MSPTTKFLPRSPVPRSGARGRPRNQRFQTGRTQGGLVVVHPLDQGERLAYIGPDVPQGFAIGSGTSPRGLHHAVIVKDGQLWHDPHPSRAGLVEITEYEVMIPLARPVVYPPTPQHGA